MITQTSAMFYWFLAMVMILGFEQMSWPFLKRGVIYLSSIGVVGILIYGIVLFIAVMSMYLYALSQHFSLRMTQTIAFSAWIFGHIVLAFISRSDKESLLSMGVFTNRIINGWAVGAVTFLVLGIYLPILSGRFNLVAISPLHW
jgi:Ca2+-transporting ATPase